MKTILSTFAIFLFIGFLSAQPVNDDCSNAIALTVGGATLNGSTINGITQGLSICNLSTGRIEVWYEINASATEDVEVVTTSLTNGFTAYISVFEGTCGSLTCYNSSSLFASDGGRHIKFSATSGNTYYIAVFSTSNGVTGDFTIEAHGQPANDDCSNAEPIPAPTVGGASSTIHAYTFASNADSEAGCSSTTASKGGVWYTVTPGASSPMVASTLLNTNTVFDSRLTVFTGSCGALTCIATNNDQVGRLSELNWYANSGVTYYILVDGINSGAGRQWRSEFELNVTALNTEPNDHCANAIPLTIGDRSTPAVAGSTVNALTDNGLACNIDNNDFVVWYSVTNGANAQDLEIVTEYVSGTSFTPEISVLEGPCGPTSTTCKNQFISMFTASGGRTNYIAADANTTYFIAVYDEGGQKGDFTIRVYGQTANDECSAAEIIPPPSVGGAASTVMSSTYASNVDSEGGCSSSTLSRGGVWYTVT
ncbi:MAG: hypothetical protein N4A46_07170, partial [Schleiferiaceae bacterium]|nr:hypothetical protein [Schleiferiaceae bacterium]